MSMNKFRNSMMMLSGLMLSNAGFATTGIVVNINSTNSSLIKVQISEAFDINPALQTGWIPVLTPWYGFFAPPEYNDLVLLIYGDGNLQNPMAALRIFNDENVALNVPPGECWLVHKSGSFLKFTNDGKLLLNGNVEIDLTSPQVNITCTAQCKITAPSVQIGNSGTLYKLITDTFISIFNNHIHPTPSGDSSPTTTPMSSANATTALEAN